MGHQALVPEWVIGFVSVVHVRYCSAKELVFVGWIQKKKQKQKKQWRVNSALQEQLQDIITSYWASSRKSLSLKILFLKNILLKLNDQISFLSLFAGLSGIFIKRIGPAEIRVNAFSNITMRCLVAETVAELNDLHVAWNFKSQSNPLKTGGKYRIPALEPISSCKRAFKLEIINITADDEGVYSCHQTCKDSGGDVCKSSENFELKVYSPPPTTGKKRLSVYRN